MTSKAKNQEQFIVRLPDGMRDRIKKKAELNGRSMNAEIVWTLENAYPPEDPLREAIDSVVRIYATRSPGFEGGAEIDEYLGEAIRRLMVVAFRQGRIDAEKVAGMFDDDPRPVSNSQTAPTSEEKSRAGEE